MTAKQSSPSGRRSTEDLADAALEDPAAFGELFERFRDYLRAEARRYRPPAPDPSVGDSDLVQDTFATACKHARRLRRLSDKELAAYLRKVLRRRARYLARARSAAEQTLADSGASVVADSPDPGQPPPDAALVAREQSEMVRAAVRELPPDYRAALDLRFDNGLSLGEIGRRLGRSADAVRMLLSRAISAVRRRVGGPEDLDR
jgi:RNA polymerase sigma-70 factor (ECF subfamily)